MTNVVELGIKSVNQFRDSGITSPTNEACGAACATMLSRWMYPDKKLTLLEIIEKTPLIDIVNGIPVKAQQGLTNEQVMALCLRLGIDARCEFMSQVSLKEYLDLGRPTICLLNYGNIPLRYKEDRFNGYHYEVCEGYTSDDKFLMDDPDILDPNAHFGTDEPIPFGIIDYALQTSDQTRLCIVIYGKLSAQVDKTVAATSTLNLRCQPTTDSYVQCVINKGDSVEVLADDTIIANGHTWIRVRFKGEIIGWCAKDLLIGLDNTPPTPIIKRTLPIGPAYVTQQGDQLAVRATPGITSSLLGRLKALTPVIVLQDDPIELGDHIWYKITSDSLTGWCAAEYLDTGIAPTSGAANKPKTNYIGIHYLDSPNKQQFLDMVKRLSDKGHALACVTVVNDFNVADQIKKLSPSTFVLFRIEDGTNPDTNSDPITAAHAWFSKRWTSIKQASNADCYQLANEWGNDKIEWLSKFYATLSDIAKSNNVRISVGDLAVGVVKDNEIPLLKPMLDTAQRNDHVLNYHAYSCDTNGDTNVMCSASYFVNRWQQWVEGFPNLKIIFGEAGNFSSKFISTAQTIENMKALNNNFATINNVNVIGASYWTFGGQNSGWVKSSIDSALPNIEGFASSL